MIDIVTTICILLILASCLPSLIVILKGRFSTNKLMGFDMISVATLAIILLLMIQSKEAIYLDFVLFFSLFGFLATLFLGFLNADNITTQEDKNKND